jgi:hypothetical protein
LNGPVRGTSRAELTRQWKADLALLDDMHHQLREVVAALPESKLRESRIGTPPTPMWLVQGIAAHDLYHAGQIQASQEASIAIQ